MKNKEISGLKTLCFKENTLVFDEEGLNYFFNSFLSIHYKVHISKGYLTRTTNYQGMTLTQNFHRLFYQHITGINIDNLIVHHKNKNRLDNRLCNLEHVTQELHNEIHKTNYKNKKKKRIDVRYLSIKERNKKFDEFYKNLNKGKNKKWLK